MDG
ncbi:hypothetical protein D018_2993A, partial [Vibrio parahaemolyticus VP2007-007]|jgi:hypothetical protein